MTAANFDRALALLLVSEGGYVNNPRDPGGATKYGITIATLRNYRGRSVTVDDVRQLTADEAGQIYHRNYWSPVRGDLLPAGVDYAVFDFAVNSGPRKAAEMLQECLSVTVDSDIGPVTWRGAGAGARSHQRALRSPSRLSPLTSELGRLWRGLVGACGSRARRCDSDGWREDSDRAAADLAFSPAGRSRPATPTFPAARLWRAFSCPGRRWRRGRCHRSQSGRSSHVDYRSNRRRFCRRAHRCQLVADQGRPHR